MWTIVEFHMKGIFLMFELDITQNKLNIIKLIKKEIKNNNILLHS